MDSTTFTESVLVLGQTTSRLEIFAMISGIIAVWLTAKKNIWCFPTGMVNVALYCWLFFSPDVKLYADAALQLIYFFLLAYGWVRWRKKNSDKPIRYMEKKIHFPVIILVLTLSLTTGFFLKTYTDASLPYLDSTLTMASLAAQWMIARKYIDNWIWWIAADIIYVPLYFYKGLPLTAFLYLIFMGLCVVGWNDWKKEIHAD